MKGENRYEWQPRRLLDQPEVDPESSTAWAVELLRSATPYQPVPGRKQRVRLGLGHGSARRAPLFLRTAIVLGLVLGGGAIASAALGGWPGVRALVVRAYDRVVGADVPATVANVEPRPRARHTNRPARPIDPPAPVVADPAPQLAITPAPEPATRRARRVATPPTITEDTSPVVEAMRALRVERNPVRARALLSTYLAQHPSGTLAEEALAMTIEAAVAHGDADAPALAARYLKLYPTGPFQAVARRALTAEPQ